MRPIESAAVRAWAPFICFLFWAVVILLYFVFK